MREIGYKGLIVSDDMEMGGILNYIGIAEAAVQSLAAGMHVVEICRDPALVFAAYEAVLREAESSPAFARLLRRAAAKVRTVAAARPKRLPPSPPAPRSSKCELRSSALQSKWRKRVRHERCADRNDGGRHHERNLRRRHRRCLYPDYAQTPEDPAAPDLKLLASCRLPFSAGSAPRGAGGDECRGHCDGGAGAAELAAGTGLFRGACGRAADAIPAIWI